jgi:hypothetical protein
LEKPIAIIKKHIQTSAWLALVCFSLISPYQFFCANDANNLSQEVEECMITSDEVENFSEYRNSETHTTSASSVTTYFVAYSIPYTSVQSSYPTTSVNLQTAFRQRPNAALFGVFRI